MASELVPLGDHVLVIDKPQETTIDGIELPGNTKQQDMVFGMVVAVGTNATANVNQRDIIVYGPYAGKTIVIGGTEFRILKCGAIEGKLRELPTKADEAKV